ncbi:hypothetical protein [Meiothermus sp. CFH 77666]|nr:hypothetical protein [Meiothermus sp. CFH 77666]
MSESFKQGFAFTAGAAVFVAALVLVGKLLSRNKTEPSGCGCGGK